MCAWRVPVQLCAELIPCLIFCTFVLIGQSHITHSQVTWRHYHTAVYKPLINHTYIYLSHAIVPHASTTQVHLCGAHNTHCVCLYMKCRCGAAGRHILEHVLFGVLFDRAACVLFDKLVQFSLSPGGTAELQTPHLSSCINIITTVNRQLSLSLSVYCVCACVSWWIVQTNKCIFATQ